MNPYHQLLIQNKATAGRRFEIKSAADSSTAEVFLYDAIVADELEAEWFGGVAPAPFVAALRGITASTIHLRINSPGGSVFAARAIEQALREHPATIVAHIDGLAASAATFIAMAADEVVMGKGSLFMVHKAWTMAYGNADDLMASAALLEKIDSTLIQTYADRTKATPQQVSDWMAAETWFTADEAVAAGFADSVASTDAKAQAWNLSAYAKAPKIEDQSPAPPAPSCHSCPRNILPFRIPASAC
jgi:ATP-dependent Clp protease protease subunit